jgi:hypothetical protein
MRQLTALDAQFLNVETASTAAHVAGLAILDSADGSVTREALAELLLDRLHLSPALSLRLAHVPLGLDRPYWAADPDFDIDHHLFEMALPKPGNDWQLAEAVAEIHARRLDRSHPLWEMHLINGLPDGRVAVYTKVHHAAIDGVSGAETLATLLDLTPDGDRRTSTQNGRTKGAAHVEHVTSAARGDRTGVAAHSSFSKTVTHEDGPREAARSEASPSGVAHRDAGRHEALRGDAGLGGEGHGDTGPGEGVRDEASGPAAGVREDTERGGGGRRNAEAGAGVREATRQNDGLHGDAGRNDGGREDAGRGEVVRGGAGEVVPEAAPGLIGMLAGAAVHTATHPVRAVQSVVRAAGDLDAIPLAAGLPGAKLIAKAARLVTGDRQQRPELPSLSVPRTPLNGPISGRRHFSFGSLSLKDVRSVAKANGISVNDVVMTLCTSALRSWLQERDALPETPLIVAVPVAVRTAGAKDLVGNQISAMVAPMPTNVPDPRERLAAVGATMSKAKRRFAVAPATWLNELCSLLPAPVTSLATPAIFRLAALAFPPINLIISNVPGPQFPLYLCGGRVLSYYPLSVLTDVSGGLNITCFSYDGMIDFGIVACPERVDDVWRLITHLRTALDELLDERVGDEFRDGVGVDLVAG